MFIYSDYTQSLQLTFIQSFLWTETPLPFVIYPTISSPGSGLQHDPKWTIGFGNPSTITPVSEFVCNCFWLLSICLLIAVFASISTSPKYLATTVLGERFPFATSIYNSSSELILFL